MLLYIIIFLFQLYDKVKKLKGADIINKVDAVEGDVMLPNLGISDKDRTMLAKEVELIFHCAATIRFDETLKKAVLLNARGTKFMLDLAKECKKLQVRTSFYYYRICKSWSRDLCNKRPGFEDYFK